MTDTPVKKKRDIIIAILISSTIIGIPALIRGYNIVLLNAKVPPPTEWRYVHSTTEFTGHWMDVESVEMGVVTDSIFFHIRWQTTFPQNLSQGDPDEKHYWRQDRVVGIKWVVQNETYWLEVRNAPPDLETGALTSWGFYSFQSSLSCRYRVVHEMFNLTDGIIGFRLASYPAHLLFGPTPLGVPWNESDAFTIYTGISEIIHYSPPSTFLLNEIPFVTTPPTIDGQVDEWKGSDRLIWDFIAYQSQAPNPLHSISLVRSSIGIHMLLEFQTPYLTHINDFFPDYNLSLQLGSVLIVSGKTRYDYNFNWEGGDREEISVPSSVFAANQSIELTFRSENIKEIWNSDKTWEIGVGLGQFLHLKKISE